MICRAEQHAVMFSSSEAQWIIPYERYSVIEQYLTTGQVCDKDSDFFTALEKGGVLSWMSENTALIRQEMSRSYSVFAPENAYVAPTQINLELTTRCPLRCPQCYCDLERGKDIPLDRAIEVLRQAASLGVAYINLSGGETMVYPHLYELLKECSSLGMYPAVALSGYGVGEHSLQRLIDSGVDEIYVSLNGSIEKVSRITRDGHHLAIHALELLSEISFKKTAVNWVAHRSNARDFANVATLCAKLKIKDLVVMAFKPDSSNRLESAPDRDQLLGLVRDIKRLKNELPDLNIKVESCYSPLRALLGDKFLVNTNVGTSKGCGAGRQSASVDVDGNFTPCRHLDFPESFDHLQDYWYKSSVLQKLRSIESSPEEPCAGCRYEPYCLSCLAVGAKCYGRLVKANPFCPIAEKVSFMETLTY